MMRELLALLAALLVGVLAGWAATRADADRRVQAAEDALEWYRANVFEAPEPGFWTAGFGFTCYVQPEDPGAPDA